MAARTTQPGLRTIHASVLYRGLEAKPGRGKADEANIYLVGTTTFRDCKWRGNGWYIIRCLKHLFWWGMGLTLATVPDNDFASSVSVSSLMALR